MDKVAIAHWSIVLKMSIVTITIQKKEVFSEYSEINQAEFRMTIFLKNMF